MDYNQALEIAKKAHRGQFRKYSGLPYISHPVAVADSLDTEAEKVLGVTHDVVEESDITIEDLVNLGMGDELAEALDCLTCRKNESYLHYIMRIEKNKLATKVKLKDLEHNMSDLRKGSQLDKYMLATYILEGCDND